MKQIKKKPPIVKSPLKTRVGLGMPKGEVFVGSYHRIQVKLASTAKVKFDDLRFELPGGVKAGLISPSRDATFNPKRPHIMLLIGFMPGVHEIVVVVDATNQEVGRGKFTSTTSWKNEDLGPGRWFTGQPQPMLGGAAWGGGPAGPQNINVAPATGTRRIAILFVDTSTQRFTTNASDLNDLKDHWLDEVFNGTTSGGVTRSSRLYYREASYNNFDLSAQVFGPVNLPDAFSDYINDDGSPKGNYYQACITAGDGLIDYTQFDTVLCVSQQVDAAGAELRKGAWPYAGIGDWGPYTTAEGNLNMGVISMPADWDIADGRELHETFSHELGHNLGLGDQYTPGVAGRNPGGWELMHSDGPLPHFSLAHRMILGWVPAGDIEAFDFTAMAAPVDRTVTLHPIEAGAPPAGRKTGVEIRIANGWNYYLEYRNGQAGHIGDQSLPTNNRVLGTDVVSSPFAPPIARPGILLLHNDIDGDGAVLGLGQDYEETDTSDPVYPTDFKVEVTAIDGAKADVRIRYGANSRPDPSIRPWPAGPGREWQSPDIEVRNAQNAADPSLANVPWAGNDNTVVAKVLNNGSLDAPTVRVNFYVKDYNVGGTPETYLGTDVRDVAAGATVEFTAPWTPPAEGHYCIVVRITLYQLPSDLTVIEMTELNNVAQSNYNHFISASSSPPSREMTSVMVGNPYDIRTRIWLISGQTNPMYRSYVENQWVWLDPGETRRIGLMFEFAPENLSIGIPGGDTKPKLREHLKRPNDFGIVAFAEDPRDNPRHRIDVIGGAQARIVTGKATRFQDVKVDGNTVNGQVLTVDGQLPVPGGTVILRVSTKGKQGARFYQNVKLVNGRFSDRLRQKGDELRAYYIALPGFGACETDDIRLKQ